MSQSPAKIQLAQIVISSPDASSRTAAVDKITDPTILCEVAKRADDQLISPAALKKIAYFALLVDIAKNAHLESIRINAIERVVVGLEDHATERSTSADYIKNIGAPAINLLIEVLDDHKKIDALGSVSAFTLGEIGESRAVPALIKALRYRHDSRIRSDVRSAAAWALERVGDHRAVEALIAALSDTDESVRINAARALGRIGACRRPSGARVHKFWRRSRFQISRRDKEVQRNSHRTCNTRRVIGENWT